MTPQKVVKSVTKRLTFCAGHRVKGHENKCRNLHGHNYVAYITCTAPELDDVGRVIDFSVIKDYVGQWIDECWDHGLILHRNDTALGLAIQNYMDNNGEEPNKVFYLDDNPTAENMAEYLLKIGNVLLQRFQVQVIKVKLYETESCYATAKYKPTMENATCQNEQPK